MQVHVSVFLKTPDKHNKTQRRGEAGSLPAWGPRDSRHSPRVNSLGFLFTSHSSDWMFEKLSTQDLQRVPTKKKKNPAEACQKEQEGGSLARQAFRHPCPAADRHPGRVQPRPRQQRPGGGLD